MFFLCSIQLLYTSVYCTYPPWALILGMDKRLLLTPLALALRTLNTRFQKELPICKQRELKRDFSFLFFKLRFYSCSFPPATPTPRRWCTQLPLALYRLHCMLKNGRGKERQLHCLRLLRFRRQVDCEHSYQTRNSRLTLPTPLKNNPSNIWKYVCPKR